MRAAAILLLGLAASCGGGSTGATGSATLSGTVRGQSLAPHDAIAGVLSYNASGVPGNAAVITLTSASGLCSTVSGGKEPRSSTGYLALTAFQVQPNFSAAAPKAAGVYSIGSSAIENGTALFSVTDASCQVIPADTTAATSGTITLTAVGNRWTGSYDLTFGFADHVTGTFDAPNCSGIAALQAGTVSLDCQ